ncbi:hypothetical protein VPNG_06331 [Cytospora leucostoma]|uniref:C-CAP/cofactor C-like domain-containing protein n=1 Tax=Cytospora leucostoma TaxID=1230097 RepID=A0A423X296_9PEZI|nr:hypothetical protein VPNG_06331 [Cytospora leucostoma]
MEPMFSGPVTYNEGFPGLKFNMDPKERFYRHFESQTLALQEEIANLGNISAAGGERKDATDHVLDGVSRLTNEVSDASEYAPPRDQMIYGQALKALREQLNIQTRNLGPKSRFQFTQKSKEAFISATARSPAAANAEDGDITVQAETKDALGDLPDLAHNNHSNTTTTTTGARDYNAEMAREPGTAIRKPSFSRSREVDISGHRGMHIILPPTAGRATSSGSVTGLAGCVVDMSSATTTAATAAAAGAPVVASSSSSSSSSSSLPPPPPPTFASLAIRDISRSLIVTGRVAGAAHITGVRHSVLVVDARQVRMHDCADVTVYLWCGSHPIIEDCEGVRFAPIPDVYYRAWRVGGGGGEEMDTDTDKNQWDQVDDFNWLKAEASPNWTRLVPGGEGGSSAVVAVIPEGFWADTVRGGPLLGTEDILRKAGIGI